MNCYLGIDPGLSGAIAVYNPITGDLDVYDMPTHTITVSGKPKRQIDLYQLGNLIDTIKHKIKIAVVERVSSMPGQGVASVFSFGFSAGVAQGVLAANLIPMVLVPPAVWKRKYGLSSDKDASRQRASQLMPQHSRQWPLKKDDGKAEAALLAHYGAQYHE